MKNYIEKKKISNGILVDKLKKDPTVVKEYDLENLTQSDWNTILHCQPKLRTYSPYKYKCCVHHDGKYPCDDGCYVNAICPYFFDGVQMGVLRLLKDDGTFDPPNFNTKCCYKGDKKIFSNCECKTKTKY